MPDAVFLEFVRQQCNEYGVILIYDEIKTGFRIAPGGAAEYFGVVPDLSTFAKALGNGYPISAIGGFEKIMLALAPIKCYTRVPIPLMSLQQQRVLR